MTFWDEQKLKNVTTSKKQRPAAIPLAQHVRRFMDMAVYPRQKKLAMLGTAWAQLLPGELLDHTCLENFRRGTLYVLVDDASCLSELDLIIREGLIDRLREECPTLPLSKIKLVRDVWYKRNEDDGVVIPSYFSSRKKTE